VRSPKHGPRVGVDAAPGSLLVHSRDRVKSDVVDGCYWQELPIAIPVASTYI